MFCGTCVANPMNEDACMKTRIMNERGYTYMAGNRFLPVALSFAAILTLGSLADAQKSETNRQGRETVRPDTSVAGASNAGTRSEHSGPSILSPDLAAQALSIENLNVDPQRITGIIVNKTPHRIQDVELAIQYHWLWRNERNPGKDPPGRTVFIRFTEVLDPGKPHRFVYTPDFQLPSRSDGHFMPEITVAGFTTVVGQRTTASR